LLGSHDQGFPIWRENALHGSDPRATPFQPLSEVLAMRFGHSKVQSSAACCASTLPCQCPVPHQNACMRASIRFHPLQPQLQHAVPVLHQYLEEIAARSARCSRPLVVRRKSYYHNTQRSEGTNQCLNYLSLNFLR
jgi:hypothetical protein